ncbi:MBL fold metallo-hydrolase [Sphingomonas canadensis]|uniref:MBL fold metallo-hydrolase n=1 Tax=Sphingomonas canadensis TaxID=1219257 RepID=A0ABW3HCQ6_9SPHN|nr:MBL fold metallo-hydrolase [Sphingomonas canadensis]MCW3838302.1 MBL fold metallo-hydrolase [Sphingomonas canadensis]
MRQVRLGAMRVDRVWEMDGSMPMPMALPGVTAADLARMKPWHWSEELSDDPAQCHMKLSVQSYVLRLDGLNILVDACNGNHKTRGMPFANNLETPWLEHLAALGLQPGDIHMVMCTHLHADHVGWNTRLENGRWVPTFPNARYVFSRKEYEHWSQDDAEEMHRGAFEDSVLPVVSAGLADLVETDHVAHREIGDGIWLEDISGHSPGLVAIHAQRGGGHAVFPGDCFHHPIQLVRPDLVFFADEDGAEASHQRRRLLSACADTGTVVFPAHFRDPCAGHVRGDGEVFRFEFLE